MLHCFLSSEALTFNTSKLTSMKKIYIVQRLAKVFQHSLLLLLLFSFFAGKINAQTYVNGNLSTGALSSNGTASPAGFTWSEVQVGNGTAGFSGSITNGFSMADNFTVPAGPSWNVTKVTFYAYSTGWAGAASPFTSLRVQIYNTNPSVGTPVPIFGDLTTNRLTGTSSAGMYRIFNATPGTTRHIWKMEAAIAVTLVPGTYWIEWQNDLTGATSNFMPPSTVTGTVTQPGNNAYQRTIAGNVWTPLADGTNPQDLPFSVDYSTGACAGTPAPGNTITSLTTACPGIPVSLSLQNATSGSGITYQWQSATSLAGPYAPIAGATSSTYGTTMTATTFFQCAVTCSGNTGTSMPVQVALTPSSGCYCTAGSPDITFEKISNVSYNTINNPSTSTAGYENFTTISTNVVQQSTLPMTVTIANPFNTDQVLVWIDFNQNGSFTDPGERVFVSAQGNGPHTGNITIPATSLLGPTRMRIRMHDAGFGGNVTPCGNSAYGQVEDYTVNIVPCVPLTITTQPADATIQCGGNATFTVGSAGSGPSFQWEQRITPTAFWTTVVNVGVFSGATTNTLTITAAPVSMNGYQYRAVFSGYCRSTDFTNPGTLTVNPLVATVNPTSANICNGTVQQLTITNITSPQPFSTIVASGPLALVIPDDPAPPLDPIYLNGANTSLSVAGVPAAAVVTGVSVKLNIAHTYVGDLVIVLKAPNGRILNLDYFLTGTGGGVSTGFVNTVISSAGTTALAAGANPYTATFRADASTAVGAAPAGATGFAPTVTTWAPLTPTGADANGTWTLAMYDGGPIDEGTLTSWEITVNYLAGISATGVWGPTTPTNTIFTDAAATIPYVPGTPANSVYVLPTTTTTYNVVVTTPLCVSAATNIPVTVNNPVGTVTAPSNASICAGGNTSFTVSAASGNTITYKWEVSTDGVTWTTVTNGGVYSGATTATLTLTNVPATYTNRQYRAVLSVSTCSSTVTSGVATLTVNALPVVVIGAGATSQLYPGITTTLTVAPAGGTYQWYRNGVALGAPTTVNTLVVDIDGLGEYTVSMVDGNGCAGSSTASQIISAAPNDIMFIYPSPTTGQFQVRYQSLDGNLLIRTLTIYDSKGARVYTKEYNIEAPYGKMGVDLSHLGKGIYRVELGDRNGKRIKTGSVVIL